MSKQWKPGKQAVELRPSRIRRDPPPVPAAQKSLRAYPTEREVWTVIVGIVLFALAIAIITFAVSDITSH